MTQSEAWQTVLTMAQDLFWSVALNVESRLAPFALLTMLGLMVGIYLVRRPSGPFLAWAFPAHIYRNKSFGLDLKILVFNWAFRLVRLVNGAAITIFVAAGLQSGLGGLPSLNLPASLFLIGLALFLAEDFALYFVHRFHHDNRFLWPFHKVHHSAQVMNPVTAYRHHPVFNLIYGLVHAGLRGATQGLLLVLIFQQATLIDIAAINAFLMVFNILGANLRHSHIWLRFGTVAEHLIVSPAMHQVHHSTDPRHFNKNYGDSLAIWDWMFGTLYIPSDDEVIVFGLADKHGTLLDAPYTSLRSALIDPFRESIGLLRARKP